MSWPASSTTRSTPQSTPAGSRRPKSTGAAICNEQTTEDTSYSLDSLRQWFSGKSLLWRTPEAKLNGYVLFGGGAGAFLAQHVLQHKVSVRKSRFQQVFSQFLLIHCILTSAIYWTVELAGCLRFG